MSDGERSEFVALVAVVCTIVVFFLGLSAGLSLPIADRPFGSGRFSFWEDSFPQWAMAVFALVATSLSWRALSLLSLTFKETKRTADAAWEANETARSIGEAQTRAYIGIVEASVRLVEAQPGETERRIRPQVTIVVKNFGQSPATFFRWSAIVRYSPPMSARFLGSLILPPESWGKDIGVAVSPETFHLNVGTAPLGDAEFRTLQSGELHLDIAVRYAFRDVFGKTIEEERTFHAYFERGQGGEVQMRPNPFDRSAIEELARFNSLENISRLTGEQHS